MTPCYWGPFGPTDRQIVEVYSLQMKYMANMLRFAAYRGLRTDDGTSQRWCDRVIAYVGTDWPYVASEDGK